METAKEYKISSTGRKVVLKGNKHEKTESAENIIVFPGGSISVCRTSNNEYWAHITVNRDGNLIDESVSQSKYGEVVESRIDRDGFDIEEMIEMPNIRHVALRIKITSSKGEAMKVGLKDEPVMAFEIAKRIMAGEILAYRDPQEPEIVRTISRSTASRQMKVFNAMQVLNVLEGATIEDVAKFCQWDDGIIEQARKWLAAGNKIGVQR